MAEEQLGGRLFNGQIVFRVELFAMRVNPAFDPDKRVSGNENPSQITAHHRPMGGIPQETRHSA
jgi:hypothetical protein